MTNPNIISDQTNAALRKAAAHYSANVALPGFVKGVDGFASVYLHSQELDLSTLIVDTPDSLSVSVQNGNYETRAYVNIDLEVSGGGPAAIVKPGFYNEKGEWDAERGTMKRLVIRSLTEQEGRELTMDLYSLVSKIPNTQ